MVVSALQNNIYNKLNKKHIRKNEIIVNTLLDNLFIL